MSAGKTVIVAVDNSEQSKEAFEWYVSYLRKNDDKVIMAYCMEVPRTFTAAPLRGMVVEGLLEQAKGDAHKLEVKYRTLMKEHNIQGSFTSQYGYAGSFIVDKAKKEGANVIIMGTRGMGTVRRTVLGSVSDYVIHHAHCPVLVYRK